MKIKATPELSNLDNLSDVTRYATQVIREIVDLINGNIRISDNLSVAIRDVNFTASNTEVRVEHGLNRIPSGYILVKSNVSTTIFDGDTSNSTTLIYLKASVAASTKVLIF